MWLRTTLNYQYATGRSLPDALGELYAEGGVGRLYRGLPFALLQTPLARFGDTAANAGVLAVLADPSVAALLPGGVLLPVAVRTAVASGAASFWRIGLTPIDTLKTTLQVRGDEAYETLVAKVRTDGLGVLFQGALANAASSFVGSYPWFLTYNLLNERLPPAADGELVSSLVRSALLGVGATCVSDCTSNSLRVLKTARQTSELTVSYLDAARDVLERDGWRGLFLRGLETRLLANCVQAVLFTVVWRYVEEEVTRLGVFEQLGGLPFPVLGAGA
jgi:hypothetical protein